MSNNAGILTRMTDVYAAPTQFFAFLKDRPSVVLPLFLVLLLSIVVQLWYYSVVDFEYLVDYLISAAGDLSSVQMTQTREAFMSLTPMSLGAITIGGLIFSVIGGLVLFSVYLVIVSNIANDGFKFKDWLSMVSWAYMPALLTVLAMALNIALSDSGLISPAELNPTSLDSLFFHSSASSSYAVLLQTIDLGLLWTIALMVLGYKVWTRKPLSTAITVILAPCVLIIGTWALLAA